ncbi:dihydrofolate reductase family protein [Nonomuraea pusilla]|uniref:RibD C-terminal domain-containing protein n=1 Tax=Nonomuraea pusilla TaxID=46177 RepID=A0A1H7KFD6_9ACTN|nr:dihydrofolate reductase family protein [Nonomuraea pusilla]SEK85482.1 RibD C-terminal domain-containing protein [Nonomuraea pusilla]
MSGHRPDAESIPDDPRDLTFAPVWRETAKIAFSTTLREAGWNTRLAGGDLAEEVAELKARPAQDMPLRGGARLASALGALGLIGEYHHPVVPGGGRPAFPPRAERLNLRLAEPRTFDSRAVLLRYDRA